MKNTILAFNKKKLIISMIALVFIGCWHTETYSQRQKFNFNHEWKLLVADPDGAEKFDFNDSKWDDITLPYAWNQSEAFKKDIVDLSTGIAWYRKTFKLPKDSENKKVFIEFEGVRQMGEVFVNGQFVGRSENGAMAFGYDLTPYLNQYPENNVIAVRTDNDWRYKEKLTGNSFQWNNKNFNANYGGIPKNVFLHITDNIYQTLPLYSSLGTTGTYVYASDFNISQKKAVVNIETQVKNESDHSVDVELAVEIMDLDGNKVAEFTGDKYTLARNGMRELHASDTIKILNFWSWGYGYLYNVYSSIKVNGVVVDKVKTRTGFRKIKFADGMIYLNDRVIMMKGYAQRSSNEWPSLGMSVPAWLSDYSNSLVVEGNGNIFRWMHITPWKQDIESFDRVGMIQAMPAGDAESDVTGRRWRQRTELMRDAIIYNRNNPSILFYECGNESISEAHMAEMKAIRDKYDPFGGRAIGSREMLDSKEAEYGGEMLYINKSADIPMWAMEYSRDEGLRKYWDDFTPPYHKNGTGGTYSHNVNGSKIKDASSYNHNQDSHAIEDVIRWFDYWEMRPGTGKRVSSGGANIIFSDTNTHYRGAENYRRSGEVDPMRIPKENYWAHKVIWDGWVDTDSIRAHIIGHWNYKKGIVKDITVVSTAANVELLVNGKSYGRGIQHKHFLFTFKNVAFDPGTITAIGYDVNGRKVCETKKETAGDPFALKLTTIQRPGGMLADGQDVTIIEVEVVDKKSKRCPTAMNMIHFDLKGEGEFIGGIAKGPDNYIGAKDLPVECGVNRIFIRSTKKTGTIKLIAASKGLKSASLNIETHATDTNPLSLVLPDNDLPSYMNQGPTPQSPSYKVSRTAIDIIDVHAASNNEDAPLSFDDNELTEWSNDGQLSTGIIEYELERVANINQIVVKFSGWRRLSYPISIYIDNQLVYSGNSPRSLGYVTFEFKPTKGKKVKIALTGATEDYDKFDIVEITGKIDQAGINNAPSAKGTLKILEVEFYEPLTE
ncbi:glycoside hydrolase family 2 protein [Geofilum sp. OHC36d9]|uniref:glycoside hydrolase family 2 protein n=1 Tax=Geofilum sp. OHC36d9 TaxID=3458413 RepID=UPI004033696F